MTSVDQATGAATANWLEQARPKLRDAVRIGPALLKGDAVVHIVGDQETQAFLRVGPREAFLMEQLDGRRSLADISAVYAERFGRRLAATHWQQLLGLLSSHGLIAPASEHHLVELRQQAYEARRRSGRSLLLWRVPVPSAADAVPAAARWAGWLLRPVAAVPLGVIGALIAVVAGLNWPELYGAVADTPSRWSVAVPAFITAWVVLACHEFGHGVACHRYGGRVTEIGIMWRFPFLVPYCKVDDAVTFRRVSHRVATSFAGLYVNLIALLPFAALWWFGPDGGWWHGLAGGLLLFGTVTTAANLIPVFQLDGYHMLEHAVSATNLQSESLLFAGAFLRSGPAGVAAYPARARTIYSGYATLAVAIVGTALFFLVELWYQTLASLTGGPAAVAILAGEAIAVAVFIWWAVRWNRRRRARGAQPEEV